MAWKDLNIRQRAALMDIMTANGITALADMKTVYDTYLKEGGNIRHANIYDDGGDKDTGKPSLKEKLIRRYLFGNLSNDEIRKRLYDNMVPFSYGPYGTTTEGVMGRIKSAVGGNRDYLTFEDGEIRTTDYEGIRDDIFATYLGIPPEDRHTNLHGTFMQVQPSQYAPTKGNEGNKYYKLDFEKFEPYEQAALMERGLELPIGSSAVTSALERYFGDHTVSHGYDSNGEYVSYYDNWDIDPLHGRHKVKDYKEISLFSYPDYRWYKSYEDEGLIEGLRNGHIKPWGVKDVTLKVPLPKLKEDGDKSLGIGTPVHFYDRIYLKDYLGVSPELGDDEFYGGTIAPAITYGFEDGYKDGGSIHIKPENRGKFTALKERTGHSASWFKENGTPAQKKMAVFALNARKWKHDDGGYNWTPDEPVEPVYALSINPEFMVSNSGSPYTFDEFKSSLLTPERRIKWRMQGFKGWDDADLKYLYDSLASTGWDPRVAAYALVSETGLNPYNNSRTSSAVGLGQLTKDELKRMYPDTYEDVHKSYTEGTRSIRDNIDDAIAHYKYLHGRLSSELDNMGYGRLKVNLLAKNSSLDSPVPEIVWKNSLTKSQKPLITPGVSTYRDLARMYDREYGNYSK